MKALRSFLLRSKEDPTTRPRSSTNESPRIRPFRAGTSPDLFNTRARSESTGSYGTGSYGSGTDSDNEPFQPRPTGIVSSTPSYTVSASSDDSQESPRQAIKELGKENVKTPVKEKEKRQSDRGKSSPLKGKSTDKGKKDKHGNPVDDDYEKLLDSEKGDYDPTQDPGREVIYADSISDLSEEIQRKMKKSHIPNEEFEKNFDTLLRVLSFVNKSNKIYRRASAPEPARREPSTAIFIAPGKSLKYPEQLAEAREKFCKQEDPKQLVKFGEFEGKGGFGRVFGGRIKNPHNASEKARVAVKVMPNKTDKEIRMNLNEVGLLAHFNHPNIVKLLRCYSYADELWVLMEFLEGGTLREATHNFQFSESHIAYVAREMIKGVAYLHQLQIAHRDLKSANVMLSMKGEVKLIDFGLCADFSEKKEAIHMCGSPYWMSPEMINQQPHSLSTDIWSLGVCLVEMINRRVPHHRSVFKAMFVAGTEGYTFSKEEYKWSDEFHDLISKCLQLNPANRPTAADLLQHPFLRKATTLKQMQSVMPAIFLSNTMTRQGLL